MNFSENIGQKIITARRERRISQTELAKKLKITQQCLSGYERGLSQIPLKVFVAICAALDAPLAWFFPELRQFGEIISEEDINFLREIKKYATPEAVSEFIKTIAFKQSNGKKRHCFKQKPPFNVNQNNI